MERKDIDAARQRLGDRLRVLVERTGRIERDLRSHRNPDSEEAAQEAENDEVLERLGESERAELEGIRRALGRIESGDYGVCEACGGGIAEGRLEAIPEATRCVACA